MTTELMNIGPALKALAEELGQLIGAPLSSEEVERAMADSEIDQVHSKHYVFLKAGKVEVTGHVEEYEPETIWITVVGDRRVEKRLAQIIELAAIDAWRDQESEEDV